MEIKSKFDHFNINVTNLERSIAFYEKALGLKEHHRKESSDGSFHSGLSDRRQYRLSAGTDLLEGSPTSLRIRRERESPLLPRIRRLRRHTPIP